MQRLQRLALEYDLVKWLESSFCEVQKEVVFNKIMATNRRFRADYYIPSIKAIVEINGGQWVKGRHNRGGKGYETDLLKINIASSNGFKVFQFTYEMLKRKEYIKVIR